MFFFTDLAIKKLVAQACTRPMTTLEVFFTFLYVATGADWMNVPQRLHEGSIHLDVAIGDGEVLRGGRRSKHIENRESCSFAALLHGDGLSLTRVNPRVCFLCVPSPPVPLPVAGSQPRSSGSALGGH